MTIVDLALNSLAKKVGSHRPTAEAFSPVVFDHFWYVGNVNAFETIIIRTCVKSSPQVIHMNDDDDVPVDLVGRVGLVPIWLVLILISHRIKTKKCLFFFLILCFCTIKYKGYKDIGEGQRLILCIAHF